MTYIERDADGLPARIPPGQPAAGWARWPKPASGGEWTLWHRIIRYGGALRPWCLLAVRVPESREMSDSAPGDGLACERCARKARGRL